MEKRESFEYYRAQESDPQSTWGGGDRRYSYWRQSSFRHTREPPHTPVSVVLNDSAKPLLSRTVSSIDMPPEIYSLGGGGGGYGGGFEEEEKEVVKDSDEGKSGKLAVLYWTISIFRALRSGNRQMKRLFVLISLNVAYSTAELGIGLFTGRVGLVSDAFHLTFGCGLLTFSLFAMAASRKKADRVYSYGYKRLEVLSAFTNALYLLFMSFSVAVEALHAFIQDESEHKHYLIVSAVTNLSVNLVGVWFFRNYARINLVYRKAEDMNYHSVCLHVLADSIRSAGLILASWFLSLGVNNAEVLCLGLVSVAVFVLVMPLFKATGGILLQMAPASIPSSAMSKCLRQAVRWAREKKRKEKGKEQLLPSKCTVYMVRFHRQYCLTAYTCLLLFSLLSWLGYFSGRCHRIFSSSLLGIGAWSCCWLTLHTGEEGYGRSPSTAVCSRFVP